MDIDRFPTIGKKRPVPSLEEALAAVRTVWTDVVMHGSAGMERTFQSGDRFVAHCWSPKGKKWGSRFYLRIANPDDPPVFWIL